MNAGLSRRFDIENAFHFEDFSDSELLQILEFKLKKQDLDATNDAKVTAIEVLNRARNRPNFGNAGEVENLLGLAKQRYQKRHASIPIRDRKRDTVYEPQDFDPDFQRSAHASANLAALFEDVVGCDEIVRKLGDWQKMAQQMKVRGVDATTLIPMNFIFKGPPGNKLTPSVNSIAYILFRYWKDHYSSENGTGLLRYGLLIQCGSDRTLGV